MNGNFSTLYEEFLKIMKSGDEAKMKKFLVDNYERLPENTQGKVALLLFEEGLNKLVDSPEQKQAKFQEEGLKIARELEKTKKTLADKLQALQVAESLQKSDQ